MLGRGEAGLGRLKPRGESSDQRQGQLGLVETVVGPDEVCLGTEILHRVGRRTAETGQHQQRPQLLPDLGNDNVQAYKR